MMRLMVGAAVAFAAWGCASGGGAAPPDGGLRDVAEVSADGANGRGGSHIMYGSAETGEAAQLGAPIDSAYAGILMAYRSLGIDIKTSDPAQHVLGNRHLVVMRRFLGSPLSTFFSCGNDPALGTPRADSYQMIISVVSTLVAKDANNTTVTTLATAQANDLATSASSVYCSSTGKLERSLLKAAGFQPE